jgi:RimJ/RimL family protein N-acetyltransferase
MPIRSLGYRTDLFFVAFDGEVIDRGDYVVARSPLNPTHYWGNFLVFPRAPEPDELPEWRELFAAEVGRPPITEHVALALDLPAAEVGDVSRLLPPGFEAIYSVVLTTRDPCPLPDRAAGIEARQVVTDEDWAQVLENHVACRDPRHELEGYRVFSQRQVDRYRRMTDSGLGAWFGAFAGERLVGDLGLFAREGLGRFQSVGVHPDFRRRGICRTLLHHASRYGFEQLGTRELVIVADPDYHAARLYESAGFLPTEHMVSLCKYPPRADGCG